MVKFIMIFYKIKKDLLKKKFSVKNSFKYNMKVKEIYLNDLLVFIPPNLLFIIESEFKLSILNVYFLPFTYQLGETF